MSWDGRHVPKCQPGPKEIEMIEREATQQTAVREALVALSRPECKREGAWDEDPEAIANAAFIVKAVNSHDALVKALERINSASFTEGTMHDAIRSAKDTYSAFVSSPQGGE